MALLTRLPSDPTDDLRRALAGMPPSGPFPPTGRLPGTPGAAPVSPVDRRIAEILGSLGLDEQLGGLGGEALLSEAARRFGSPPDIARRPPLPEIAAPLLSPEERETEEERFRRRRELGRLYSTDALPGEPNLLEQALSGAGGGLGAAGMRLGETPGMQVAGRRLPEATATLAGTPPAQLAGQGLSAAGEFFAGPGAGPLTGGARDVSGFEQFYAETENIQARLQQLSERLKRGDRTVLAEAEKLEGLLAQKWAEESLHEIAKRHPDYGSRELIMAVAQSIPATLIAPGIASGAARNAVALMLDPGGQLGSVGLESLGRGVGAAARATRGVSEASPIASAIRGDPPPYVQRLRGQQELPFEGEAAPVGVPDYARLGREASERAWEAGRARQAAARGEPSALREAIGGYETAPEPSTRYYHGTAADFPEPDPSKFDPNGMYGPGYYLTDNPEVAASYAEARGRLRTANQPALAWHEQRLADMRSALARQDPRYDMDKIRAALPLQEAEVARIRATMPEAGPNIRPVDVPQGMKLLEAGTPIGEQDYRRLIDSLDASTGNGGFILDRYLRGQRPSIEPWDLTGKDVYNGMLQTKWGRSGAYGEPSAGQSLAAAGYDGIRYPGGQIMPITDAAGKPIEHNALAIFGNALGKITNPLSGGHGLVSPGDILPGRVGRSGTRDLSGAMPATRGALAGAAGSYQASEQEGLGPEEAGRNALLAALGGAALGGAGSGLSRALAGEPGVSGALGAVGRRMSRQQLLRAGQGEMAMEGVADTSRTAPPAIPPSQPIASPEAIDSAIASVKALIKANEDPAEIADLTTKLERLEELRFGGAVNVAAPKPAAIAKAGEAGYELREGAQPAPPPSSIKQAIAGQPPAPSAGPPVRFEAGKKLTASEREIVLSSVVDAYKPGGFKVLKGIDPQSGDEIYGWEHRPDLFVKSDITGRPIRYYITLPDGRKAHPSELFPGMTPNDVETAVARQEAKTRNEAAFAKLDAESRARRIVPGAAESPKNDANARYQQTGRPIWYSYFARNDAGDIVRVDGLDPRDEAAYQANGFKAITEPVMAQGKEEKTRLAEWARRELSNGRALPDRMLADYPELGQLSAKYGRPPATLPPPSPAEAPLGRALAGGTAPGSATVKPWQMRAQDYSDYEARVMGETPKPVSARGLEWHAGQVRDALSKGLPVPETVLADYPGLAAKYGGPRPPANRLAETLGSYAAPGSSPLGRAIAGELPDKPLISAARPPAKEQMGFGGFDWEKELPTAPKPEPTRPAKEIEPAAPESPHAGAPVKATATAADGTFRSGPVGLDIGTSLLRQLVDTQYEGSLPRIISKELVQNAFDISREAGTPVAVNISTAAKSIDVLDRGSGMGPGVVRHVFLNVGESLKGAGASGGKGTAKVAFLGNARKFYLHTVGKDADVWGVVGYNDAGEPVQGLLHKGDGKLKETVLIGSRDELLAKKTEVLSFPAGKMPDSVRSLLPEDMRDGLARGKQTGTEIRVQPLDQKWDSGADGYLVSWADMFVSNREHRAPGEPNVDIAIDGKMVTPGSATYLKFTEGGEVGRLPTPVHLDTIELGPGDTPTARLDIWASNESHDASRLSYVLANRGQPQEVKTTYVSTSTQIPKKLWINVEPLDKSPDAPQKAGYPWNANRTDLTPEISDKLKLYIEKTLVEKSRQQGIRIASGALTGGPAVLDKQGRNLGRIVDATGSVAPDRLAQMAGESYVRTLMAGLRAAHDALLTEVEGHAFSYPDYGSYIVGKGDFLGLGISPEFNGLNIGMSSELGTARPQVLMNPWASFRSVSRGYPDLEPPALASRWASELLSTLTHEISHNAVPTDQSPFGWAMTHLEGRIDESVRSAQHARLKKGLSGILADKAARDALAGDAEEVGRSAKQNVLKKWSTDQPAADVAANAPHPGGRRDAAAGPLRGPGLAGREGLPGGDALARRGPGGGLPGGGPPDGPTPARGEGAAASDIARALSGEPASPIARAISGRR